MPDDQGRDAEYRSHCRHDDRPQARDCGLYHRVVRIDACASDAVNAINQYYAIVDDDPAQTEQAENAEKIERRGGCNLMRQVSKSASVQVGKCASTSLNGNDLGMSFRAQGEIPETLQ